MLLYFAFSSSSSSSGFTVWNIAEKVAELDRVNRRTGVILEEADAIFSNVRYIESNVFYFRHIQFNFVSK